MVKRCGDGVKRFSSQLTYGTDFSCPKSGLIDALAGVWVGKNEAEKVSMWYSQTVDQAAEVVNSGKHPVGFPTLAIAARLTAVLGSVVLPTPRPLGNMRLRVKLSAAPSRP